jgi:hypothetical protein
MHSHYKIITIIIILFNLFLLKQADSLPIAGFKNGVITEKNTGVPIEKVIVVRSWDIVFASPGGAVNQFLTLQESITDKKGEYSFAPKFLKHLEIPLLTGIEENNLIAYKPGYKFVTYDPENSNIQMDKIPDTYYLRYEECNKARGNYYVDFYETQLLKEVIEKEEEVIKTLPRYVPGVFYQGFTFEKDYLLSPQDIAIDAEDNIYVADGGPLRTIKIISNKGEILYKEKIYLRSLGSGGKLDLERDNDGNLYFFTSRALLIRNIRKNYKALVRQKENEALAASDRRKAELRTLARARKYEIISKNGNDYAFPFYDMHISLGQGNTLFLIRAISPYANTPVLYRYDFEGNLLCKREIKGESVKPDEGYIQLIDLTTDTKGNVIVVYSYFNPYWDKAKRGYMYRNGILKFKQNCDQISDRALALDDKATSITTTSDDSIIISDKLCFYVYDKNLNPLFKYDLSNRELGEISIKRIKADLRGQYLYLIESNYRRILKYDLQNKELYTKAKN